MLFRKNDKLDKLSKKYIRVHDRAHDLHALMSGPKNERPHEIKVRERDHALK